jgi:hypothetical protein
MQNKKRYDIYACNFIHQDPVFNNLSFSFPSEKNGLLQPANWRNRKKRLLQNLLNHLQHEISLAFGKASQTTL